MDYSRFVVPLITVAIAISVALARNAYYGRKKRKRDQSSIDLSRKQYPSRWLEIVGWVLAIPFVLFGLLMVVVGEPTGWISVALSLLGFMLILVRRSIWLQYTETTVRWRSLGKAHERLFTDIDEFEYSYTNSRQNMLRVWFVRKDGAKFRESFAFDPLIYEMRPITDRITFYALNARWPSRADLAAAGYHDSLAYVSQLGRQHLSRSQHIAGSLVPAIPNLIDVAPQQGDSSTAAINFLYDLQVFEAKPFIGTIFRTLPSQPLQLLPLELWVPYTSDTGGKDPWFPRLYGESPRVEKRESLNIWVDGVHYAQPGVVLYYGKP